MKQIEIKAAIEKLIDTFLYAGKVSIELREKGLIRKIKSDNTPVILNSTFLLRSPSSYPKINSSDLTSSVDEIVLVIPEQFRN